MRRGGGESTGRPARGGGGQRRPRRWPGGGGRVGGAEV